jgi:hypothetical protein
MPPYFSLTLGFRSSAITTDYVKAVYEAVFSAGFPFKGVLPWGAPADMKLDAITVWNQERLQRGFQLGFSEDVSNGYRQIVLDHPAYHHCRLLIHAHSMQFDVIVPESDVTGSDDVNAFAPTERLAPIEELARRVWPRGLFAAIQTSNEAGFAPPVSRLERGTPASVHPFAILDRACRAPQTLDRQVVILEELPDGACFLRRTRPAPP